MNCQDDVETNIYLSILIIVFFLKKFFSKKFLKYKKFGCFLSILWTYTVPKLELSSSFNKTLSKQAMSSFLKNLPNMR